MRTLSLSTDAYCYTRATEVRQIINRNKSPGSMEKADCVVVGAGVIGLAVARALALAGREVIVLEAHDCIGSEISSRNSEVIHAGIYYPAGSLKAMFCVAGRKQLYRYCEAHHVPFKRCGKFIIAAEERQQSELQAIWEKARINGVDDIVFLEQKEMQRREPQIKCVSALWSPSTGVIDSHSYMLALQADLENAGGVVVFDTKVNAGSSADKMLELALQSGDSAFSVAARTVINCAGLGGDILARAIAGIKPEILPVYSYAKGNYFTYAGKSPFTSLIYPLPDEYGLGVHVTHDMAGKLRFGPDVEWVDEINYDVDPRRGETFYAAIRSYWPELADGSLLPAYAGIRPKINHQGAPAVDFVIQGEAEHGVSGLINLFGIESPGLTSSLALADYVKQMAA
ncbi:MAG TPA: NAD(P)/FAD-dependent oxidoreductase [Gammaproteobacteria bacterium]|nr:NAD(P)/FAD-dependent oxidoreductase [Gammaproteobacteria bacterium]